MRQSMAAGAIGVLVAGQALLAQKPEQRKLVTVREAHMSTPARQRPTPALVQRLRVPPGFRVSVFAEGLGAPRMMALGPDGTVYVTRRDSNDVIAVRDADGDGRADAGLRKVVQGLENVHGIALHQGTMYLATNNEVYAAPMAGGGVGAPRAIITDLPDAGQHPNRTIAVGPDNMLYITVGSTCNVCADANPENSTVLRASLDGATRGVYASGLRNTIGFGWHPTSGEMYGWDQGFDWHGDDFPPEEFNKLQATGNYGFPYCHTDRVPNDYYASAPEGTTKEAYCRRTVAPLLTYQAHTAGIQMQFYAGQQFPAEYRNDAYIALRGSWNREPPAGYKIVRIHFQNGQPATITDFVSGFLAPDGQSYFGRPAGVLVAADGALLVSDDTNGMVYRVSYGTAK